MFSGRIDQRSKYPFFYFINFHNLPVLKQLQYNYFISRVIFPKASLFHRLVPLCLGWCLCLHPLYFLLVFPVSRCYVRK